MRDPFYCDEILWGETQQDPKKVEHAPLIKRELFDKVQRRLGENTYGSKARTGKDNPFRPFLKCGYCGYSVTDGEVKKGYVYYNCTQVSVPVNGGKKCEQGRYYREEKIDQLFARAIEDLYIDDSIAAMVREHLRASHNERELFTNHELKRLQSEQTRLKNQLGLFYEDRLNGVITVEEYKAKRLEKQEALRQTESDIARLERQNFSAQDEGSTILELLKGFRETYMKQDFAGKAKILRIVLRECRLKGKDGEESLFLWNPPFDKLFFFGEMQKNGEIGEAVKFKAKWGE